MHISYENTQVETQVIDSNVQSMIDQKVDHQKLIEASIDSANDLIDQLKQEQDEIIQVSAKFARFTSKNAIAVFNDDLDAYLDLLIREEEAKKQSGLQNDQVLNGLRDVKQNYIEQKKIFDTNLTMLAGEETNDISVNDIDDMLNDLYNLPLSGDKLQGVIDCLKKTSRSIWRNFVFFHN